MHIILYVDDEPDLLDLGKTYLELSGEFTVETARSVTEAETLLAKKSFDAIISDYHMPEKDGIAFLRQVRSTIGDIPFILFTGRGREEVVIDAINNGADSYLQKGGDPSAQFAELMHKIRKAIGRRQAAEALKESEQRLADIINFLPDATFAVDTGGKVIAWNLEIEEMTGVPAEKMLGRGEYEYALPFYGDRRPLLIDLIQMPDEEIRKRDYSIVKKDRSILIAETMSAHPKNTQKIFLCKASQLTDKRGNIIGAIESIRDITQQKHDEDRLKEAYETIAVSEEELREQLDTLVAGRAALERSELRFSNVIRNAPFGMHFYELKPDGRLIFTGANPQADTSLSLDHSRLVGRTIEDAFPGIDRTTLPASYRNVASGGTPWHGEQVEFPGGQGGTRTYSVWAFQTIPGTMVALFVDTTRQKQREDDLRNANERLTSVGRQLSEQYTAVAENHAKLQEITRERNKFFDLSLDLLCIATMDGFFVRLNPEWERTLGYRLDELEGKRFLDFVHPDDMQSTVDAVKTLAGNTELINFVNRYRCRDGTYRWIEWRSSPYEGKLIYAAARDITEHKRTEEALRDSEIRFRKIFEHAQIGMALSTPDFLFRHVNPEFCHMLGYSEDELYHMTFADITHPDHLDSDKENIRRVRDGEIPVYSTEKRYVRKDRVIIWASLSISSIRDEHGTLLNYLALVEDITERKTYHDALEQANRKLNLLSGITRHDILNQLTALTGYLTLSQQFEHDPEKIHGYLEKELLIAATIERQIGFTRDYEQMGVKAPLWQNVQGNISRAVASLPMKGTVVRCDGTDIEVLADPLFEKVFYNLFDNALKYGGEHLSEIVISVMNEDGNLVIACEDNGAGISESDKARLFERGFGKHTGFGLFLTREILSITGITIRETGSHGTGARFEMSVPRGEFRAVGKK
jgi:PAS domain S-box-containing protein